MTRTTTPSAILTPTLACVLSFALLLGPLTACGAAQRRTTDGVVNLVTPQQTATLIERGALVLDFRSRANFDAGHLPTAQHASIAEVGKDTPRNRPVVVYDAGGTGLATAAAKKLIKDGHPAVYELRTGYASWQEGLAPATQPTAP